MFWQEYAKIPRHTSQNAITEGDFKCILARNCEGTEQLQEKKARERMRNRKDKIFALAVAGCLCLSGLTGCGEIKMSPDNISSKSDDGLM